MRDENKGKAYYRKALEGILPFTEQGDATAQYHVARCIVFGKAGLKEAEAWYIRAAEGGNTQAMCRCAFSAALAEALSASKNLGGSTGARLVEINGQRFICKSAGEGNPDKAAHIRSEVAADNFKREMGSNVPECRLYDVDGATVKLSRYLEGAEELREWWNNASAARRSEMREKLAATFDIDCMLSDWDCYGMNGDNVLVANDEPWMVDNGGALSYRAQGAKKQKADWNDAMWPDDFQSMLSNSQNARYLSGVKLMDVFGNAAKRDWSQALDKLDPDDRAVVEHRIKEAVERGDRVNRFKSAGIVDADIELVDKFSYELCKEGFREECPKTITDGDFGFCRASGTSSASSDPFSGIGKRALAAAKTINHHQKDGAYNQSTLNDFYAFEPELDAYLKKHPQSAEAKHYKDAIAAMKAAVSSQAALPQIDTSVVIPTASPAQKSYVSLREHLEDFIGRKKGAYNRLIGYFRAC